MHKIYHQRTAKVRELGYKSYTGYINSSHWKKLKKEYFDRFHKNCRICGADKHITLHHLSYKRLGEERFGELKPVCNRCHELMHAYNHNPTIAFDHFRSLVKREGIIAIEKAYEKLEPIIRAKKKKYSRVKRIKAQDLSPEDRIKYGFTS